MTNLLTAKIGNGWSGLINDNGNIIVYGAYINRLGQLVTPTLHYFDKKHSNTDVNEVKAVIISAKPNDSIESFADITPISNKIARMNKLP